jgi:hypothetical protein
MLSTQIDLAELIRLLREYGNKYANSIFLPRKKSGKMRRLARKFAFEKVRDERAWAEEIFEDTHHSASYILHRARLRWELLDRLFHLEIRTGSERRKAMYKSHKTVFMVRVLLMLGARRTAMSLVPKAIKRAREFELTSDRIELLDALTDNATLNGWRLKFAECDRELRFAMSLKMAEIEMSSLSHQISVESVGRARPSEQLRELGRTAPHAAYLLFREFPTFNVGLGYYRIAVASAEIRENTEEGLSKCVNALTFLSRFPTLMTDPIRGEFELKRLWLAIASKNFEMANAAAIACEQCFKTGTNNWFIAKEYELLLLMHTTQWKEAAESHKLIVKHQRFPTQPEQVRQKWILFGYYAMLVSTTHTSSIPSTQKRAFNKILREVPIYKKEKAGYNASLYILQYLILASRKDYDGLVATSEGITKYINRYLRGRTDTQLYGFLKTLLVLKKCDFDVVKTRKRAKKYIEQFNRYGREKVDETQTLPFDLMWAWISEWVETLVKPKEPI